MIEISNLHDAREEVDPLVYTTRSEHAREINFCTQWGILRVNFRTLYIRVRTACCKHSESINYWLYCLHLKERQKLQNRFRSHGIY